MYILLLKNQFQKWSYIIKKYFIRNSIMYGLKISENASNCFSLNILKKMYQSDNIHNR